jgi:hypothetical protein
MKVCDIRGYIRLENISLMELREKLDDFILCRHIITQIGAGGLPYFT